MREKVRVEAERCRQARADGMEVINDVDRAVPEGARAAMATYAEKFGKDKLDAIRNTGK